MRVMSCVALILAACGGGDPADVAGTYSVNVTNRDNGCNLANWTVGDSSANIPVTIVQDGTMVSATVMGLTGVGLNLALGANVFSGDIDGNSLNLDLFGTRSQMSATCVFTYNAKILGDVTGDVLEGRVEYRAATTSPQNPDCMAIQGCLSFQDFNGTRPPT
jgi:hypothetical protein